MKKNIVLLISLIIFPILLNGGDAKVYTVPTPEEVEKTENILCWELYKNICLYRQNNSHAPKCKNFSTCLKQHQLLKSDWVEEKEFLEILEQAHKDGASEEELEKMIKDNYFYQRLHDVGKRLLIHNLMQAYRDCCGESRK